MIKLDGFELDVDDGKGQKCRLKVNTSEPKTRLFVGNIPKTKTKEEIRMEFDKISGNKSPSLYQLCFIYSFSLSRVSTDNATRECNLGSLNVSSKDKNEH